MKNIIALFAFLLVCTAAQAQFQFGVKAGLSSTNLQADQLILQNENGTDAIGLSIKDAKYGYHFGVAARIGKKFYIQPEVVFNSTTMDYDLEGFSENIVDKVKSETFQNLDIPVLVGVKMGPLRLNAGPVGHVFINSSSELTDVEGYEQKFDNMTLGWQAGLGLDIKKFNIDLRYEGNFSEYGDHINFLGEQYSFDEQPGRLVASVGFMF